MLLLQLQQADPGQVPSCSNFTSNGSCSRLFPLQKPFYNHSTEIHATLKESLTAIEPRLFNGTANGFVPGRPVLDVPGWRDRYTNAAAAANSNYNAMSRLRIFSGTSNPVSLQAGRLHTTQH